MFYILLKSLTEKVIIEGFGATKMPFGICLPAGNNPSMIKRMANVARRHGYDYQIVDDHGKPAEVVNIKKEVVTIVSEQIVRTIQPLKSPKKPKKPASLNEVLRAAKSDTKPGNDEE